MANETNGWKYYFYSRLRQLVFLQMKPKWQMKLMAENTIFIVDLAN